MLKRILYLYPPNSIRCHNLQYHIQLILKNKIWIKINLQELLRLDLKFK